MKRSRSPWFTPAFFVFLKELQLHNDREWFERNKERYLRDVRDPFLRFIGDVAPVLKKLAPRLVADPRPVGGSMFRIFRDTRFSNDKTPYKTNAAASFRHERGRDVHGPGLYVSLAPWEVEVGGGVWHPEAEPLQALRKAIVEKPAAWRKALATPGMSKLSWWGDSLKRTPRGFPEDHPLDEWLRRKDFAAGAELTEKDALSADFLDKCVEVWRPLGPAMKVMAKAVGMPW
jgi:uncharacterized protein (TIGR02453 family)